jgi:hypothetical protein
VSFGTYARRVRDPSLPYGCRINALAGCVQRYRPIGYLATFAYLEHVAGPLHRDEGALLRALDALSASRDLWLKDLRTYAGRRRVAKRLGQRSPGKTVLNPNSPACWYGDPRRAALFTLSFLLRKQDRIAMADTDVVRLASSVLESGGEITSAELEQLNTLRQRCERLREVSGWPHVDWPNLHTANQSLWILRQLSCAAR